MKKISRHLNTKTKNFIIFIFLLLLILSVYRISFDIRRGPPRELFDKTFAGKIIEKTDTDIFVRDRFGNLKVFSIASSTEIFAGKQQVYTGKLHIDQFVMIQSEMDLKNPSPIYTSKNVRILEQK